MLKTHSKTKTPKLTSNLHKHIVSALSTLDFFHAFPKLDNYSDLTCVRYQVTQL